MSIDNSALDLLSAGGSTAKFTEIGDVHKGTVVSATRTQQTDFDDGSPLFWDDDKTQPRWQVVIAIQTDERDADNAADDGVRNLYAKGELLKAIQAALKKAGAKLEAGGTLAVKFTGLGEAKKRGMNPPKLFSAQYEPPSSVTVEADDLF